MNRLNFMITGVGGQGTILSSDILAAVGVRAGYDVKKSDILGLAVRGGSVLGHIRWGEAVYSPIVPEGRVDYLIAFEILEGMKQLSQVQAGGTVLLNQQEIHPASVTSGLATYPTEDAVRTALSAATEHVYWVPGLDIAQELGNAKVLNVVLLGALSALLSVDPAVWEDVLRERVPTRFTKLNLEAFHSGRAWIKERM
ncbi:MAG: indolepyruvate oxidoreductase subunit beta [Anaerolineae bacterium]